MNKKTGGLVMPTNEVEIPMDDNDDYEVVPLTPLRRIEKRLEAMETSKSATNFERFIDKVLNMVEMNQKIVDEVVKANQGLREDISVLISKMDDAQSKMTDFMEIIKDAGEEGGGESMNKDLIEHIISPFVDKFESASNKTTETSTQIVDTLSSIEKRLKTMNMGASGAPTGAGNILQRRRPPQMPPHP